MVVELDPVADRDWRVAGFRSGGGGYTALSACGSSAPQTVLLRGVGCDELLLPGRSFDQRRVAATGEDQAVVRAQQEGLSRAPACQKRTIRACSSALSAVRDLPLRETCQPSNSRLKQSITSASVAQPSRPSKRGTDPSPSVRWAGMPWSAAPRSGPKPDRALPHLPAAQLEHPLHRVLVEPQQGGPPSGSQRDGLSSIIALIGSGKAGCTFGGAFTDW